VIRISCDKRKSKLSPSFSPLCAWRGICEISGLKQSRETATRVAAGMQLRIMARMNRARTLMPARDGEFQTNSGLRMCRRKFGHGYTWPRESRGGWDRGGEISGDH